MKIFIPVLIVLTSFCGIFIVLLLRSLRREKHFFSLVSAVFLLFNMFLLVWLLVTKTGAGYVKSTRLFKSIERTFKIRTGEEIYGILFGPPAECLQIVNYTDQIIPRLDCCIWLEFKTCPKELNRIIKQRKYRSSRFAVVDAVEFMPSYSPTPVWWKPSFKTDSLFVLRDYNSNDANRDKILIFNDDSTHAFYCDMAD